MLIISYAVNNNFLPRQRALFVSQGAYIGAHAWAGPAGIKIFFLFFFSQFTCLLMHMHTHTHTHTHSHTHTHTHAHTHTRTHTHTLTHTHIHICTPLTHTHTHINLFMYTRQHAHTCIYIYSTRVYTYTAHAHVYIHTQHTYIYICRSWTRCANCIYTFECVCWRVYIWNSNWNTDLRRGAQILNFANSEFEGILLQG